MMRPAKPKMQNTVLSNFQPKCLHGIYPGKGDEEGAGEGVQSNTYPEDISAAESLL